ncbi:MAG: GH92 family glycosyl hydrolase [Kiritimatiellia bacterium]
MFDFASTPAAFRYGMALALTFVAGAVGAAEPLDSVRATTGTINSFELSAGNIYPAVCRPWGAGMWSPITKPGHREGWFYDYTGRKIYGIKQTFQPSPWAGDYGQWYVLPVRGDVRPKMEDRFSHFSHKSETIRPDYYRVYLGDMDVDFELTATARAAIMRLTWGETDRPGLVVDAMGGGGEVRVDQVKRRVYGVSRQHGPHVGADFGNRFVLEFDRDIVSVEGESSWRLLRFAPVRRGETMIVKAASSFTDEAAAVRNLRELDAGDFESVRAESASVWNRVLSRFRIETPDVDRRRMFYTALYRATLFPRAFFDFDEKGKPIHRNPTSGGVHPGYFFAGTGFWDTFRALFPLLNFAYPEVNARMTEGLANSYRECGWLPEWSNPSLWDCMTGNNSASVVADAWLSGAAGQAKGEELWQALVHGANNHHPSVNATGRAGVEDYNRLGYVAHEVGASVARTLEYAYDDWCIWKLGQALGRPESETDLYRRRAGNWRNVIDPKVRLANGRWRNGRFRDDFNPLKWGDGDFVEGNSLHWTWSVFHDVAGLMEAMGGRAAFAAALDDVLARPSTICESDRRGMYHEMREMQLANFGQYAHGNQPIQHMLYLYDWCGEPWKTQYWVREVMDRLYAPTPDGYCGDEDNGQTSAWYVWSALGFYPVCPGSGEYALGSPAVEHAAIQLPGGHRLTIDAPGAATRRYIAQVTFNGNVVTANYLRRADLMKGGVLKFTMSEKPVKTRGVNPADRPYSMSVNEARRPVRTVFRIDASGAGNLATWAEGKLRATLEAWLPKIVRALGAESFEMPETVKVCFRDDLGSCPAYTAGDTITLNRPWIARELNGEALGAAIHELVHIVQGYPDFGEKPGWLAEGIADYVRWFLYESAKKGAEVDFGDPRTRYDASYRITANFLAFVERKKPGAVAKLNGALRRGSFSDACWREFCGASAWELAAEWSGRRTLRVGSYNIRNENGDRGSDNDWNRRRTDLVEEIRLCGLDVIGLQEVLPGQDKYLRTALPEFAFVGEFRGSDRKSDEASPVLYRRDRFDLEKSGTFWLSEHPDEPGSKSWGTACTRICSYAILKDRSTGRRFCFANTHTDHVSEQARVEGTQLIIRRMKDFGSGAPIILTGDHNCTPEEKPARLLREKLADAREIALVKDDGPKGTFNGWKHPPEDKRIDYIYVTKGTKVLDFKTRGESCRGSNRYPSDHFPVTATLAL